MRIIVEKKVSRPTYVRQHGRFKGCVRVRWPSGCSVAFNKMSRGTGLGSDARFNKGGRLEDEFIRDRHYIIFREAALFRAVTRETFCLATNYCIINC